MRPIKRIDFIRRLRNLGFRGPYSGAKHEFMIFNNYRLSVPSNKEYSASQLGFLLKEIESIIRKKITDDDWESLS